MSVFTRSSRPRARVHQAQALVEFAIILPVMLVMTLGLIDLGRAFVFGVAVQEGTRQAARLAANVNYDSAIDDKAVLGRVIGSANPALAGCAPATSPPQTCNGFTLSLQVDVNGTTFTSFQAAKASPQWTTAIQSGTPIRVTVTAVGPVALLPGVSTGVFGLSLPQINVQGKSAMVIL